MRTSTFIGMLIGLFLFLTTPMKGASSFQDDATVVCVAKDRTIVSAPIVVLGNKNPITKKELVVNATISTNKEDSTQSECEPRNKGPGSIVDYILKINGP